MAVIVSDFDRWEVIKCEHLARSHVGVFLSDSCFSFLFFFPSPLTTIKAVCDVIISQWQ